MSTTLAPEEVIVPPVQIEPDTESNAPSFRDDLKERGQFLRTAAVIGMVLLQAAQSFYVMAIHTSPKKPKPALVKPADTPPATGREPKLLGQAE